MTFEDPYRPASHERCAWCTGRSAAHCPRCNRQVCESHGIPPESLCAGCAEHELMRVSHAGRRYMALAVPLVGVAAIAAYGLYELRIPHPALWVATVAVVLAGVALMVTGLLSRPLARRRIKKERALSTVEREAIERRFRDEVAPSIPQAA